MQTWRGSSLILLQSRGIGSPRCSLGFGTGTLRGRGLRRNCFLKIARADFLLAVIHVDGNTGEGVAQRCCPYAQDVERAHHEGAEGLAHLGNRFCQGAVCRAVPNPHEIAVSIGDERGNGHGLPQSHLIPQNPASRQCRGLVQQLTGEPVAEIYHGLFLPQERTLTQTSCNCRTSLFPALAEEVLILE